MDNLSVDSKKAFGHVTDTNTVSKSKTSPKDDSVAVDIRNIIEANITRTDTSIEDLEAVYKVKPSNELYNTIIVLREAYSELKRIKV